MAYAVGGTSTRSGDGALGCRALQGADIVPYVVAQVIGAMAGAALLYLIGRAGLRVASRRTATTI